MNRRLFLSKTAAATAGLALALPKRSHAQASPNEIVNVAITAQNGLPRQLQIAVTAGLLQPGQSATFEVVGSESGSKRWFGIYTH